MNKNRLVILCLLILAFVVRLYRLDEIPGEMWGDVIEHYKLAKWLLDGNFFINYRFGGDGPLFTYILAFVGKFFGLSFYSIKLITVAIGTLLVITVYFLADEFFKKKEISIMAGFLTAVSFWSLSFSRQAKPHILVPLFVTLTILFILKKRHLLSGFLLGIGMFSQAGFWAMPLVFFTNLKLALIGLLSLIPFAYQFIKNFAIYSAGNSFYGEKLNLASNKTILDFLLRVFNNCLKNLLSFNFKGDIVFRHTISGQPLLDTVSGVFFVLGFFLIFKKAIFNKNKVLLFYFIYAFFVLQIPSVLDVNNPLSIPNMGRMIGIIPFVYISVAYGMYHLISFSTKLVKSTKTKIAVKQLLIILVLGYISYINLYNYFIVYPKSLPNNNTPFGKLIAKQVDTYPQNTDIYIFGCCWGYWGQPEPDGIKLLIKQNRTLQFFEADSNLEKISCEGLKNSSNGEPIVLVVDPRKDLSFEELKPCFHVDKTFPLEEHGWTIAWILEGSKVKNN